MKKHNGVAHKCTDIRFPHFVIRDCFRNCIVVYYFVYVLFYATFQMNECMKLIKKRNTLVHKRYDAGIAFGCRILTRTFLLCYCVNIFYDLSSKKMII